MRVRKKHKLLAILIGSAVFTSGARLSYNYLRFREVKRHFHSVTRGTTREDVVHLLGEPNYHKGDCGSVRAPANHCVLEYVYSHPLGPFHPEYYIVSFSSDDRVVQAEHVRD